jgi:hypothetical protein
LPSLRSAPIHTRPLATGRLSIEAVLPNGWESVGTENGRTLFLRSGSDAASSGNVRDGVIVVHSTDVDWAKPQQALTPMQAIANHSFAGHFAAACASLETAAIAIQSDGYAPSLPFHRFPAALLETIAAARSLERKN